MDLTVNILGVVAAAVAYYILGALWYSPLLFAKPWMSAMGKTMEEIKQGSSPAKAMGISAITALTTIYILAVFVKNVGADTLMEGAMIGFLLTLGLIATSQLATVLFEGRNHRLYVIYLAYQFVGLMLAGGIITTIG
jgi:hypothetical protein